MNITSEEKDRLITELESEISEMSKKYESAKAKQDVFQLKMFIVHVVDVLNKKEKECDFNLIFWDKNDKISDETREFIFDMQAKLNDN